MPPTEPPNPPPAYLATPGTLLSPTPSPFYTSLSTTPSRRLLTTFTIPIRSGRAWHVRAGQLCRITTPAGPQVGDLNVWSTHNPRERFWAARTRQLHAAHVSVGDRLWSCLPYLRPMVTITGDSLAGYGIDEVGGRCHDLLGTRCDPYVAKLLTGESFDYHCHSNLTRAVLPYGLTEFDVHDALNVFQVTGLNRDDKYFMGTSPAKPGDYFEFFAEIDVLCALSACPGGDLSAWSFDANNPGEKVDMVATCRPLGVEVYEVTDEKLMAEWKPIELERYEGLHGVKMPSWGA